MKEEIEVFKPNPHEAQQKVLDNAKRFNVLRNGRRWGKSKLGIFLAMETIIDGDPVGTWFPTYEFAEDFWEEIKERLEPIIKYKSESKHIIRTINGGSLKIWSLEKARSGRGRKYKRAIIDEAAFAKDLKDSWTKTIRATLTDMRGDAWFLSTPNGQKNYFFELDKNEQKHDNWKSFHMPSSSNPYISEEELAEIRLQLDELTWLQEFEAEFVNFAGRPFAYSFDSNKHLKKLGKPVKNLPIYLCFDFNLDPITCIVAQHPDDRSSIRIHKEFRLSKSDIYLLCDAIIAEYGNDYFIRITGDASGQSGSAMVQDNLNYYTIIKNKLGLPLERFIVPNSNPAIKDNRVLVNSILSRHVDIFIDPDNCPHLIDDLKFVEVNDQGDIDKKKDKHRTHLLDCFRYYCNSFHSDFIRKYTGAKK